jgi:hypothetical protein
VVLCDVGVLALEVRMEQRKSQEIVALNARTTQGTRRTAMRVMHRKSQGIVAVYEQDPTAADAGTRKLVFETGKERAQLTSFPLEWQRLSDDELIALRRALDKH